MTVFRTRYGEYVFPGIIVIVMSGKKLNLS